MSFLQFADNQKQIKQKCSLAKKFSTKETPPLMSEKLFLTCESDTLKNGIVRRTSLSLLPPVQAGMTVEAALILPLFLFFVLNLLSVIEMLRFHGNVTWALHETCSHLAVYSGWAGEKEDFVPEWLDGLADMALSYGYVREKMVDCLGSDYVQHAPVADGKRGILFSKTNLGDQGAMDLVVTYRLRMPFSLGGILQVRLYNTCYVKCWTGYPILTDGSTVYVTAQGSVYHTEQDCRHLDVTLRRVSAGDVARLRNSAGKRYKGCELCIDEMGAELWVTETGDKYHGRDSCSALRRTIGEMSLKEARERGYPQCVRCAGEG